MNHAEEAKSLINNCLFFTGDRERAKSCALYMVELFIGHLSQLDEDKNLQSDYIEVKKELYKL
jgi:hypothetical protein